MEEEEGRGSSIWKEFSLLFSFLCELSPSFLPSPLFLLSFFFTEIEIPKTSNLHLAEFPAPSSPPPFSPLLRRRRRSQSKFVRAPTEKVMASRAAGKGCWLAAAECQRKEVRRRERYGEESEEATQRKGLSSHLPSSYFR